MSLLSLNQMWIDTEIGEVENALMGVCDYITGENRDQNGLIRNLETVQGSIKNLSRIMDHASAKMDHDLVFKVANLTNAIHQAIIWTQFIEMHEEIKFGELRVRFENLDQEELSNKFANAKQTMNDKQKLAQRLLGN